MSGVKRKPALPALALALAVILADQASKEFVRSFLEGGGLPITSFFNLVSGWNSGIAFSMFQGENSKLILIAISLGITVFLIFWLIGATSWLVSLGAGLVIGGALGNVIDRVRFGAVFDFLDVYWGGYHWPAFNLADSAICVGVGLLLVDGLFLERKRVKKGP